MESLSGVSSCSMLLWRTSSMLSRIQSVELRCFVAVGGRAICWRSSYTFVKLLPVLSASPRPPASTLSQNSDVPWGSIALCRNELRPRREDSAEEE